MDEKKISFEKTMMLVKEDLSLEERTSKIIDFSESASQYHLRMELLGECISALIFIGEFDQANHVMNEYLAKFRNARLAIEKTICKSFLKNWPGNELAPLDEDLRVIRFKEGMAYLGLKTRLSVFCHELGVCMVNMSAFPFEKKIFEELFSLREAQKRYRNPNVSLSCLSAAARAPETNSLLHFLAKKAGHKRLAMAFSQLPQSIFTELFLTLKSSEQDYVFALVKQNKKVKSEDLECLVQRKRLQEILLSENPLPLKKSLKM